MPTVTRACQAAVEDLSTTSEKAELVDGKLVRMPPTGEEMGYAGDEVFVSLREHARIEKIGRPVGDNKGFIVSLPNRKSFSPDAAYVAHAHGGMNFYQGAPVFAVEVRSEEDYGPAAERASDSENPTLYRRGEIAEAEPAVPSWAMAVDDLFAR